jgi:hypothetical protein
MTSVSGVRWFVTFIDCYTQVTWIYMLKHKSEVLRCFQDFHILVSNQFNAKVQIICIGNGKEYVNNEFMSYTSDHGIIHQTTCPSTPPQNGVAERKNRHLLEVARSMMFQMNVPKYLWSEAVMTTAYLINRMSSRTLGMKSLAELLLGQREFKLPPKVFGCVCFVRDHRPSMRKIDPHVVKCIFVGYFLTQKGYKCWDPIGRKLFVNMDVIFREFEPYYTKKGDLDQCLKEFSSVNERDSREGENDYEHTSRDNNTHAEIVGSIPSPQVDGVIRTVDIVNDNEKNDVENDDVVVDNERTDVEDDEVVVVGTIPCPTNTSGEIIDKKGTISEKQPIVYQRRRFKT